MPRSIRQLSRSGAALILSAFASDTALVLAHPTRQKSNEIPVVQTLLGSLALNRLDGHGRCYALSKKAFEQVSSVSVHLIAQVKVFQPALVKPSTSYATLPHR